MNLRIMSMQNDASHIINLTQIMLLKDLKCFTIVCERPVMLHLSSLMSKGSLAVLVVLLSIIYRKDTKWKKQTTKRTLVTILTMILIIIMIIIVIIIIIMTIMFELNLIVQVK